MDFEMTEDNSCEKLILKAALSEAASPAGVTLWRGGRSSGSDSPLGSATGAELHRLRLVPESDAREWTGESGEAGFSFNRAEHRLFRRF